MTNRLATILAWLCLAVPASGQAQFNDLFDRQAEATGLAARTQIDPITPPSFALEVSDSGNFQVGTDQLNAFLDAREDIRSAPVVVTNGQTIRGRYGWAEPIIFDEAMCDSESGDVTTFSPHAFFQDRYHGLVVTAAEALELEEDGTNEATLAIDPLDRSLPQGFVLGFEDDDDVDGALEYVELTAPAAQGATSIAIRLTSLSNAGDEVVKIADNATAIRGNRFSSQSAVNLVQYRDLIAWGRPTTFMNEDATLNAERGFATDGIVIGGTGAVVNRVKLGNFPGVGLWVQRIGNTFTRKGRHTPFEGEATVVGHYEAAYVHIGGVWDAVDTEIIGPLITHGCSYFGHWFRSGSVTNATGSIHVYGVRGAEAGTEGYDATAIRVEGILRAWRLEGETSTNGIDFLSGSSFSEVHSLRAYDNFVNCVRVYSGDNWFGKLRLTHKIENKPCLLIGDFAARNTFEDVRCEISDSARGVQLGENVSNAITDTVIRRCRIEGGGDLGVWVVTDITRGEYNFELSSSSFANAAVYFGDPVDLVGVKMRFKGPSACTIRWPSPNSPGTFASPNIPEGIDAANDIEFVPTG